LLISQSLRDSSQVIDGSNDELLGDHNYHNSLEPQDLISFIESDTLQEPLTKPPDIATIEEQANMYYPILVSLHASPQLLENTCPMPDCQNINGAHYNCNDCLDANSYCYDCIKARHSKLPFHKISMWNDKAGCYSPIKLTDLGMVWRLAHNDGTPCSSNNTVRKLQVFHTNGMHNFAYYQCICNLTTRKESTAHPTQLLANKLFPATSNAPTTAFTFELLSLFDALNTSAFSSIKQYCDSIIGLTPREHNYYEEVR
jgi:hypothetical protein